MSDETAQQPSEAALLASDERCRHDVWMAMSCHWCGRRTGSERRCTDEDCTQRHTVRRHHYAPPWPDAQPKRSSATPANAEGDQ